MHDIADAFHVAHTNFSEVVVFDPSQDYGSLWEKPEHVDFCRGCNSQFQGTMALAHKHHCRSCASIFCDSCAPSVPLEGYYYKLMPTTMETNNVKDVRICQACKLGECPNQSIKDYFRKQLDEARYEDEESRGVIFDKSHDAALSKKFASKNTEKIIRPFKEETRPLQMLKLVHGSYYGEDGKPRKNTSKALPTSGYFEMHNKSKEVICLKVVYSGPNLKMEIPRPSYIAIPPNESAYSFFNHEADFIDVIVLHKNAHPIPQDKTISYDTRADGASSERISKCAQVREFYKGVIYHIHSYDHNVLLKHKGQGEVVPRMGNGFSRVGLLGIIQGRRHGENLIDYNTNIFSTHQHHAFHAPLPVISHKDKKRRSTFGNKDDDRGD